MDNMIISGILIYFPKPNEPLPTPDRTIRSFAVERTSDERCSLLAFISSRWITLGLPTFDNPGKAIMAAVHQGKVRWR